MKNPKITRRRAHRAFTLVEMLVVIAVIGILAAMLMPAIHAARVAAKKGATKTEIRGLETAFVAYERDWNAYPPNNNFDGDATVDANDSEEAIVYYLGTTFRVSASGSEVSATKNADAYFNFQADRLLDSDGDGNEEYRDPFREDRTVNCFRFDNNDDEGSWDASNINSNTVDIWSAGYDG
ncbi:MAG: type II secretion system protein, partial [Planctomycetes bacterium]|nr:type II secretion system protein [Planctomycetota bacterium]